MDDAAVVAAISAGKLDGLAAALDKYAGPLYKYCHSMAPEFAAEAVHDTFVVAWCRLETLRDPGKLYSWLQTIAGNECYRRTLASDVTAGQAHVAVEATLPPRLPGQVLSACVDNTPAGRACRVSVTHRAGPFGHDGFPKAADPSGKWRYFRRNSRVAAAVVAAVVAATATAAGLRMASGSHPGQASASPVSSGPNTAHGAAAHGAAALPITPARVIPYSPRATRSGEVKVASKPSAREVGEPRHGTPAAPVQTAPPPPSSVTPPPYVDVVPLVTLLPQTLPPPPPPPGHGNGDGDGNGNGNGNGNGKGGG